MTYLLPLTSPSGPAAGFLLSVVVAICITAPFQEGGCWLRSLLLLWLLIIFRQIHILGQRVSRPFRKALDLNIKRSHLGLGTDANSLALFHSTVREVSQIDIPDLEHV